MTILPKTVKIIQVIIESVKKTFTLIAASILVSSCGTGGKEIKLSNGGIFTVKKENITCSPVYTNTKYAEGFTLNCIASGTVKMLNGDVINYTTPKQGCWFNLNGNTTVWTQSRRPACIAAKLHNFSPEMLEPGQSSSTWRNN